MWKYGGFDTYANRRGDLLHVVVICGLSQQRLVAVDIEWIAAVTVPLYDAARLHDGGYRSFGQALVLYQAIPPFAE